MSKTYFITSDIHSYYNELITALDEAGFDINNSEHILIVNGDLFDRGEDTLKVLEFIKSIPKERRILIRGNHEYLLRDLLNRKDLPKWHDVSNRTLKTVFHLLGIPTQIDDFLTNDTSYLYYQLKNAAQYDDYREVAMMLCEDFDSIKKGWIKIQKQAKKTGILDWIFGDEWIDYYELDNYIITHAFIPLNKPFHMSMYRPVMNELSYHKDWRTDKSWQLSSNAFENATWGCPYQLYDYGFFNEEIKNNKTLIVGHWHCYDFRQHYCNVFYKSKEETNFDIFYSKHLIAIDACTAYSEVCNVLVIKNGKCYQHDKELVEEVSQEDMNQFQEQETFV